MAESLREQLRSIIWELKTRLKEIGERQNQPDFNKALDAKCDWDEALNKILAAVSEEVERMPQFFQEDTVLNPAERYYRKAERANIVEQLRKEK